MNTLLRASMVVSVFGIAGLVVTLLIGFETPHNGLLWFSAICLLAPPVGVFIHLTATHDLSRSQKRAWLQALIGKRAPWAFAEYLCSSDRRSFTDSLSKAASAPGQS